VIIGFTPSLLYPSGQCPRYLLDRRLYGTQSWSWLFGQEIRVYCPSHKLNHGRRNIALLGYGLDGHYAVHTGVYHKPRRRPHLWRHIMFLCWWVSGCCFLWSFVTCITRRGSATDDFEFSYKGKFRQHLIQESVGQVLLIRFRLGQKKKEPCKRVLLPPVEMLRSSRKTSGLTDVIRTSELHFISLRLPSLSFELPCLLLSLVSSHLRFQRRVVFQNFVKITMHEYVQLLSPNNQLKHSVSTASPNTKPGDLHAY
jgi:hypothetical protein